MFKQWRTFGGVYAPCIYSHVRWSYRRRFWPLSLCPLSVERYELALFVEFKQRRSVMLLLYAVSVCFIPAAFRFPAVTCSIYVFHASGYLLCCCYMQYLCVSCQRRSVILLLYAVSVCFIPAANCYAAVYYIMQNLCFMPAEFGYPAVKCSICAFYASDDLLCCCYM